MLTQETIAPNFTSKDARIAGLLDDMHAIQDLKAVYDLAEWDQNTGMPEGAAEVRGYHMATLQGVMHERWTDPRLGSLLGELGDVIGRSDYTDADRGLVRAARRDYDRATKLPRELVEEMARVQAGSFDAWRRARENNDFASFAPWLGRTVALQREVADRLGYAGTRYDALLDLYEPGMTVSALDRLFAPVREVSTTLLRRIEASGKTVDDSCLKGEFSEEQQVKLCKVLLRGMGYDFSRGGIAISPHPFTTSFGSPFDVRVTIHPDRHFIQSSVMAAIHEGGHALYEQGSAEALVRTPVAGGASMGMHESQSRLWENAIGRSEAYWRGQYAAVREAFPGHFAAVDAATFARALNKVRPSLIRNAKYREYVGVEPATDSEGVLQDIHWTSGFGYFPSYTLGNLYGAQIYNALRRSFPDFDERLATGDTAFILDWLRENMYTFGAVYLPEELMQRVTGETPNPEYFVRYLTSKFEAIYHLPKTSW